MQTHDFITDESRRHLLRVDDSLTAPAFVKECSVDAEAVKDLPAWQFALPAQRLFPIDSAGHVWLSYAYMKSASVQVPGLSERLVDAAESFKIGGDQLKAIDEAFAPQATKQAAAPKFAVTVDFGAGDPASDDLMIKAGGVRGFYPINTKVELVDAARALQDDCFRIPEATYIEGCRNIVKEAKGHPGVSLPSLVEFYGEERLPNLAQLEKTSATSLEHTKDTAYVELLKQATTCAAAIDIEGLQKCADAWLAKDQEHFGPQALPKQESIYGAFQGGDRLALVQGRMAKWASLGNALVPHAALADIAEDDVRARFSKGLVEQIFPVIKAAAAESTEVQSLINGLPDSVQNDLARLVVRGA